MDKFKVGDRVRALPGHYTDYTPGSSYNLPRGVGTVVDCGSGFIVIQYGDKVYPAVNPLSFDLVAPASGATSSAIRTVTRREIVPGVYGVVHVNDPGSKFVRINVDAPMGGDSLREAARLFNELADVLEERAGEQQKEAA